MSLFAVRQGGPGDEEALAALDAAGIPNECVVVPYGNHLMDMVDGSMLNRAYLELTLRWFERFE